MAQRRGFRECLAGLLVPRERNKTLTCLAGAEPVTGSKLPAVQRLQFFLSESVWDPERVNDRRLELLRADPATAPHGGGVLVIDDSGDRKDGTKTAHVGRQWLGRYGKTDNGVVTVTTVWADERLYYPVHAVPYTPARHPWPAAGLAEIVRIYGLRHWVEQSYKQVKDELGWADFQVRSDVAIRRHQALVNCAFSFCWDSWPARSPPPGPTPASPQEGGHRRPVPAAPGMPGSPAGTQLAPRTARGPQLADPRDHAHALVAGLVKSAPAR